MDDYYKTDAGFDSLFPLDELLLSFDVSQGNMACLDNVDNNYYGGNGDNYIDYIKTLDDSQMDVEECISPALVVSSAPQRPLSMDQKILFSSIVGNVLSNNNVELIDSFWRTLCTRRPKARISINNTAHLPDLPGIVFCGLNYGIAFCSAFVQLFPDRIFRLSNPTYVRRDKFKGNVIKMNCVINATRVYQVSPAALAVNYIQQQYSSSAGDSELGIVGTGSFSRSATDEERAIKKSRSLSRVNSSWKYPPTCPLEAYIASTGKPVGILQESVAIVLEGHLYLFLNENSEIQKVELQLSMRLAAAQARG